MEVSISFGKEEVRRYQDYYIDDDTDTFGKRGDQLRLQCSKYVTCWTSDTPLYKKKVLNCWHIVSVENRKLAVNNSSLVQVTLTFRTLATTASRPVTRRAEHPPLLQRRKRWQGRKEKPRRPQQPNPLLQRKLTRPCQRKCL